MDNIGDLLYVLFIVIALIVSVMKKRKQQQAVPPFVLENEDDSLPEDLRELFQRRRHEASPKPQPVVKQEIIKKAPVSLYKTGIVTTVAARHHINNDEDEFAGSGQDFEEVDWQKAVIMAEILKRPQHLPG